MNQLTGHSDSCMCLVCSLRAEEERAWQDYNAKAKEANVAFNRYLDTQRHRLVAEETIRQQSNVGSLCA